MPTDWQSIVVYLIVLLTLGWMIRGSVRRRRQTRAGCGKDCGCGDGLQRDPAIQRFIDRRNEKK